MVFSHCLAREFYVKGGYSSELVESLGTEAGEYVEYENRARWKKRRATELPLVQGGVYIRYIRNRVLCVLGVSTLDKETHACSWKQIGYRLTVHRGELRPPQFPSEAWWTRPAATRCCCKREYVLYSWDTRGKLGCDAVFCCATPPPRASSRHTPPPECIPAMLRLVLSRVWGFWHGVDQWLGHMLGNVQRWGDDRGAVPVAFTGLRSLLSVKSAVVISREKKRDCSVGGPEAEEAVGCADVVGCRHRYMAIAKQLVVQDPGAVAFSTGTCSARRASTVQGLGSVAAWQVAASYRNRSRLVQGSPTQSSFSRWVMTPLADRGGEGPTVVGRS